MQLALEREQGLTEAKPLHEQLEFITDGGQMPKRWSAEQDLFLEEHANKGAEWCAKEIRRQFGVSRSAEATRRHGTRIGCSWVRYEFCPECGKPMQTVPRKLGVCKNCNMRRLRDAARERSQRAVANQAEDGEGAEFKALRREYDRYRRRLYPRKCGDSVKLSSNLSTRRSEGKEISERD